MAESKPATPRPATAARFCLAGILFVIVAFAVEGLWSPDLWWQLATGRWIVDHGQIPSTDPFSFTAADNEWIALRWLFCLAIYGVWQLGGPTLLIAGKTIFLMLTFGVLVWAAPRTSKTLLGALLMALAVVASLGRFAVRPELITYLFLATFIVSTERLASDRCRRGLWFMPLAQIVWTNAHTLFILGPVVCWAYWLGSLLRPSASQSPVADTEACAPPTSQPSVRRRLLITATLVTAACFINPYVYRGAFFPFKLFLETQQTHFLTQHIDELRTLTSVPIATWSWNIWAVVILFAASALTFLKESKSWHPGRLILWLALAYLAVTSIRNLALFAIVATAVSLHNVEERLRTLGTASDQSMAPRADRFAATGQWALALFLIAFAWLGASNRFAQDQSDNRRAGLGVVEQNIPCQAVDFLLEANVAPEIYSSMADGNYLIWASNGKYRAFVDGRLEVYGDEFLQKYFTQTDDFDAIVTKHGINAVLLQRENFAWLVARLAADPKWALVHLDARNLVYLRDVSANSDLIARHRLDPQKPFTPRGDEPDESPPGLANWIGGVGRPWYSVGMARTFLTFGAVENAETYLQRALDHYPDDVDARSLPPTAKPTPAPPTRAPAPPPPIAPPTPSASSLASTSPRRKWPTTTSSLASCSVSREETPKPSPPSPGPPRQTPPMSPSLRASPRPASSPTTSQRPSSPSAPRSSSLRQTRSFGCDSESASNHAAIRKPPSAPTASRSATTPPFTRCRINSASCSPGRATQQEPGNVSKKHFA